MGVGWGGGCVSAGLRLRVLYQKGKKDVVLGYYHTSQIISIGQTGGEVR